MPRPDDRPTLALAAVAVTMLLWSSAFVAIRHLAGDFGPGALSLGRLAVAAVVLAPLALRRLVRPTRRQLLALVVIGSLWYGVYNLALNDAERRVDAGTAAMLIQVSPILIAVLAVAVLHERAGTLLVVGLGLAFAGVVLIAVGSPGDGSDVVGVLLCLLAAASYSVSIVSQKPLAGRLPALMVTWAGCCVGAVVCLPFAGQLATQARAAPAASVLWLVYLGVFPTAIAFTSYAFALSRMSASSLGVTTYLVPPLTIVESWLFLGEAPSGLGYVGGALCLVGVAVARRPARAPQPQQR